MDFELSIAINQPSDCENALAMMVQLPESMVSM